MDAVFVHRQACTNVVWDEKPVRGFLQNGSFHKEGASLWTFNTSESSRLRMIGDLLKDLKSCGELHWGRAIHARALESRCMSDMYVVNAVLNMYRKCGSMVHAQGVFDSMQKPEVVSWNALISGYAENGQARVALDTFSSMKKHGYVPDSFTYVAALKSSSSLAVAGDGGGKEHALELGRAIHSEIVCPLNPYVHSTLIDMYAKCERMDEALQVYNMQKLNVVSWTTLILGYAENGQELVALDHFDKMKTAGFLPNCVTYLAALKACTSLAGSGDSLVKKECLERGRRIHSEIGSHSNSHLQSTLIDMYASCGSMVEAREIFDSISRPNVVAWTALILGYAANGEGQIGLNLFTRMKQHGCVPNSLTFIAALKACSMVGALALGRKIHTEIKEYNSHVVTCLVDFYAKCGSMEEAREVFELHPSTRNVATWSAILAGYSRFGDSLSVFELFRTMQEANLQPSASTFVCLLLCCSHAGLAEDAKCYFEAMHMRYGVAPTVLHYTCMVDVLGRGNRLNEAIEIVRKMPHKPDAVIWMTLLGACHQWKNVEIGREAFQALVDMEQNNAFAYVLMAQIYGSSGLWDEQKRVLELKKPKTTSC